MVRNTNEPTMAIKRRHENWVNKAWNTGQLLPTLRSRQYAFFYCNVVIIHYLSSKTANT